MTRKPTVALVPDETGVLVTGLPWPGLDHVLVHGLPGLPAPRVKNPAERFEALSKAAKLGWAHRRAKLDVEEL